MPTYETGHPAPEPHILRGKRIEEFTSDELFALHEQLGNELPDTVEGLGQGDMYARWLELELIEEELERRDEERSL